MQDLDKPLFVFSNYGSDHEHADVKQDSEGIRSINPHKGDILHDIHHDRRVDKHSSGSDAPVAVVMVPHFIDAVRAHGQRASEGHPRHARRLLHRAAKAVAVYFAGARVRRHLASHFALPLRLLRFWLHHLPQPGPFMPPSLRFLNAFSMHFDTGVLNL